MPTLGADMEAGTLVEWLKKPGDAVARGDIIAVVDTEKGAIEIEAFDAGVIDRLMVEPGQKTPSGPVLALIRSPEEPAGATPEVVPPVPPTALAPATSAQATAAPAAAAARGRVSPAARKAAAQLHVNLDVVEGRGPGGSITVADVERAAPVGKPAATTPDRLSGLRAAMAAAMARAKREIPHLYLSTTVDLAPALTWLKAENERRPVTERLLPVVMFIKAVARACTEVAAMNGFGPSRVSCREPACMSAAPSPYAAAAWSHPHFTTSLKNILTLLRASSPIS